MVILLYCLNKPTVNQTANYSETCDERSHLHRSGEVLAAGQVPGCCPCARLSSDTYIYIYIYIYMYVYIYIYIYIYIIHICIYV